MIRKLSIVCFIISLLLILNDSIKIEANKKIEEAFIEQYFEQEENTSQNIKTIVREEESYMGILEIPKINLKKGFYNFESKNNTVEKGLEVINKNCLPFDTCHFILASHSGTASISYFKNLEKLQEKDSAFLYYKKEKKEYILKEIIYQKKNGTISLKESVGSELILTTCNKEKDDIQNIYIFAEKK